MRSSELSAVRARRRVPRLSVPTAACHRDVSISFYTVAMSEIVPPGGFVMPALLNRERAILEFNRRVLAQAQRDDVPLLERLRYVCIVSSNMDEFFEVRFADSIEAAKRPGSGIASRELEAIASAAHAL